MKAKSKEVRIRVQGEVTGITRQQYIKKCLAVYDRLLEKARRKGIVTERYFRQLVVTEKGNLAKSLKADTEKWERQNEVVHQLYYSDIPHYSHLLAGYILGMDAKAMRKLDNYAEAIKVLGKLFNATRRFWKKEFLRIQKWVLHERPFNNSKDFSNCIRKKELREMVVRLLNENNLPEELVVPVLGWYKSFFPHILLQRDNELRTDEQFCDESANRSVRWLIGYLSREREKRERMRGEQQQEHK